MSAYERALDAAASFSGQVLKLATEVIDLRPAAKPLHPRGSVLTGTLRRFGDEARTGAKWLDGSGTANVMVRQSRAVGLPSPLPDIFGLALRVPADGGHSDILFASTGLGGLTRFVLTPARVPSARPMTTLLPYRTPIGPVMLCADYRDEVTIGLGWATPSGAWHPFAELCLQSEGVVHADAPVSFDPVHNLPPGLESYEWVRRLREPAYAAARRSRRL